MKSFVIFILLSSKHHLVHTDQATDSLKITDRDSIIKETELRRYDTGKFAHLINSLHERQLKRGSDAGTNSISPVYHWETRSDCRDYILTRIRIPPREHK